MHDDPHRDGQIHSDSDHELRPVEAPPVESEVSTPDPGELHLASEESSGRGDVPDQLDSGFFSQFIDETPAVESGGSAAGRQDSETRLSFERVEVGDAEASSGERLIRSVEAKPTSVDEPPKPRKTKPSRVARRHHPDPLTQSLTLLATIAVMLLAARFVVPRIIEEVRYSWHRGALRAEYEAGTSGLQNVSLDAINQAYQMVTAAVGPSVVHIDVQRRPSDLAQMLGSGGPALTDQGSGVVVDGDGHIVTNRHVVAGGEDITVTLSDGRRFNGRVIGSDALTDLAVLKVDADRLMPITWGDSDRCKVGSPVWAVGSPFGLDRTVTFGILSGKHRMVRASTQYQDFMQSDVAVNPGNSGGPLVDARGTLIGINTAIVGDTYRGVSFSIPSNVARQVYKQLRDTGRVQRGWLGVMLDEVAYDPTAKGDPLVRGAKVGEVTNVDSPAAIAGLMSGDVITAVDDQPVRDTAHLMRMIGDSIAGSEVRLGVVRNELPIEVAVTLGSRPAELNRE